MAIEVSTSALGFQLSSDAVFDLADPRGVKWKRKAMLLAGDAAFRPVVIKAKSLAPSRTGLTRSALTAAKPIYNATASRQVTKRGNIRKRGRNEYMISTTLSESGAAQLPINSKGKPVRYPFMVEVGVKPGRYIRGPYVSGTKIVPKHYYNRTARRNPYFFQHTALTLSQSKVVTVWTGLMDKYLSLYASSKYKTLLSAIKAEERNPRSGQWR